MKRIIARPLILAVGLLALLATPASAASGPVELVWNVEGAPNAANADSGGTIEAKVCYDEEECVPLPDVLAPQGSASVIFKFPDDVRMGEIEWIQLHYLSSSNSDSWQLRQAWLNTWRSGDPGPRLLQWAGNPPSGCVLA